MLLSLRKRIKMPTIIHVAAPELVNAGKLLRGTSMDSHQVETIRVAFQSVTLTDILIIAVLVPVRMKRRFTTCGPLDALQFMTSTTVKSANEMP